jgi:hypothetical protein
LGVGEINPQYFVVLPGKILTKNTQRYRQLNKKWVSGKTERGGDSDGEEKGKEEEEVSLYQT